MQRSGWRPPLIRKALGRTPVAQAQDFIQLVREYVSLVERSATTPPHAFLAASAQLLPCLYAAGLALPEVEPDDPEPAPVVAAPPLPSFGAFDIYSEVFDPYVHDQPVMASLADDLGDIYSDLAGPLREFDAGRTANAVWSWRFNVKGHCGDHIVDALRVIHRAIHVHMPIEYESTMLQPATIEIDGTRFSTLEEFYTEVSRVLIPGAAWGHNLDAFNDILRGGFGTPAGGFTMHWRHHELSAVRLGYPETIRQLELRLSRCHPTNRTLVSEDLARARNGIGPTVFDWLVEIIQRHGPGGSEETDGVTLELL